MCIVNTKKLKQDKIIAYKVVENFKDVLYSKFAKCKLRSNWQTAIDVFKVPIKFTADELQYFALPKENVQQYIEKIKDYTPRFHAFTTKKDVVKYMTFFHENDNEIIKVELRGGLVVGDFPKYEDASNLNEILKDMKVIAGKQQRIIR